MINKIILLSIKNKFIVLLFTLILLIAGIIAFNELPIDAVPDITNNQVQIITTAPSFAAQDIERKVTFPIEQACSNINGIKEIRSFSRFGLSLITVVFEDDIDIYWARQQISERLQKVQNEISTEIGKPELAPITTGLGEIYQYVIRPKKTYEHKYSLTDLREIQDWIVRRQLLGIKGVADVSSFGGKLKQYEVAINPYQLNAHQISIYDVMSALEKNNQNTGSAYIEKNSTAYFIRTEGLIGTVQDIENILIKKSDEGLPIQIKDVAKVRISYAPRYGALVYTSANGEEQLETAGGIVMMLKGENSNKVIERVKNKIKDIQNNLPEGVVIEPFLDRTKMVNSTIHTVFKNLIEGAIIVILVLIAFLGNIRFGLLVASVIPLSMLFAVIMMNVFKVSGNLMSLGALDFGLIVDGAVIIVEAVLYKLSHLSDKNKLSKQMSDEIVYVNTSKLMNAAVFGQIIILIVYLPVLYFSGIEGKMFRPMAQTVIFALAGAFVLSVTYIPAMSSILAQSGKASHFHWTDDIMLFLERLYLRLFKQIFRRAKILIGAVVILFFISVYMLSQAGGEFMPTLEEGDFAVETRLITGSGLSTTIDYCKQASKLLAKEFPDEVQKVVSKIGSGEIPTDPMPIESADMMVILNPVKHWKKAKTFDELSAKMQEKLQTITGLSTNFQYPVQMRFNELIAGAKQDIVCKIFGENIDSLSKYAHQIAEIISKIKGVEGIYEEPIFGQPQIVIQFNREKLAQYNIDVQEANTIVKCFFAGNITGQLYNNERRFDIVVRLDTSFQNFDGIKNLLIPTKDGHSISIDKIAEIKVITDVNQIQREDAKRRIIVGFNVRNRDVETVINELKNKLKNIHLPAGYYVTYGGSFENLESAKKRLMITVPVALLLIFVMLYFSNRSVRTAFIIYSTIPMSIIGGVWFLYFRNIPFSVSAGVGFIALFGIAVLNGIVLISEFQQLMKQNQNSLKVVMKGVKIRLRPVLMTATVASLGFFPMFVNTDVGANVQRPLATVVIGGLLTSTLLTLFILPIIYYHFTFKKKTSLQHQHLLKTLILFSLSMFFSNSLNSQNIVTYQTCIDSAMKNNIQLKIQNLLEEYQKELTKTAWNINKTNVQIQYGQYNSMYNDNAIHIQQSINFPTVYQNQKNIYQTQWNISTLKNEIEKRNIKNTTGKLFYDIVVLSEKIKLFKQADSIYQQTLQWTNLQYQKGNISELEKNILNNLVYENQIILSEYQKEKNALITLLKLLTGIKIIEDIEYRQLLSPVNITDTLSIEQLPDILMTKQNIIYQHQKIKLEQSKLLPDFNFGYTNQSLTGWGSDNSYYPTSQRFQYIYAGLEVPLFFSHQSHKIKSEKKLLQISNYEYEWEKLNKKLLLEKLLKEYYSNQKIIQQYETTILENARKIRQSATLNFQKGNISFIEWRNYIEQSIQPHIHYLDYIQKQNQIIFELKNYTKN